MINEILEPLVIKAANGAASLLGRRIEKINNDLERQKEIKKLDLAPFIRELHRDSKTAAGELYYEDSSALLGLTRHVEFIRKWSDEVSFRDLARSKKLATSYVDLDTYLIPKSRHIDPSEKNNRFELVSELSNTKINCVILGVPGAGKTTSIKRLTANCLSDVSLETFRMPMLVRFRSIESFASETPLVDTIASIIGYKLFVDMITREEKSELSIIIVAEILNILNVTLYLDGFDEIPNENARETILSELQQLSQLLIDSRFIITCRTGEFPYSFDGSKTYEIAPLDELQIREFSNKWLKNNSESFLDQIRNSPYYDTAIRPLTLAHLCAIYDRVGKIPDRPKTIYRKIVYMLLEDWDEERRINRNTSYAKFEVDRKFEFLCYLAYSFTIKGKLGEFSEGELRDVYNEIAPTFELPLNYFSHNPIIGELESHTGLFVQCGYESFEFAHRSLQEFLTAEYIVKLPSLSLVSNKIADFPSELAVATAISSFPSLFFVETVFNQLNKRNLTHVFYETFINRLSLERPDFVSNPDLIIALLNVLEKLEKHGETQEKLMRLITPLLTTKSLEGVLRYYGMPTFQQLKSAFQFQLHSQHSIYALPSNFEINVDYKEIVDAFVNKASSASRI